MSRVLIVDLAHFDNYHHIFCTTPNASKGGYRTVRMSRVLIAKSRALGENYNNLHNIDTY